MPIYVNILYLLNNITGVLYASCNATGLISTFAGFALHLCIKLNAEAQRVPRRKIPKPEFTSDIT